MTIHVKGCRCNILRSIAICLHTRAITTPNKTKKNHLWPKWFMGCNVMRVLRKRHHDIHLKLLHYSFTAKVFSDIVLENTFDWDSLSPQEFTRCIKPIQCTKLQSRRVKMNVCVYNAMRHSNTVFHTTQMIRYICLFVPLFHDLMSLSIYGSLFFLCLTNIFHKCSGLFSFWKISIYFDRQQIFLSQNPFEFSLLSTLNFTLIRLFSLDPFFLLHKFQTQLQKNSICVRYSLHQIINERKNKIDYFLNVYHWNSWNALFQLTNQLVFTLSFKKWILLNARQSANETIRCAGVRCLIWGKNVGISSTSSSLVCYFALIKKRKKKPLNIFADTVE